MFKTSSYASYNDATLYNWKATPNIFCLFPYAMPSLTINARLHITFKNLLSILLMTSLWKNLCSKLNCTSNFTTPSKYYLLNAVR